MSNLRSWLLAVLVASLTLVTVYWFPPKFAWYPYAFVDIMSSMAIIVVLAAVGRLIRGHEDLARRDREMEARHGQLQKDLRGFIELQQRTVKLLEDAKS